VFENAESYGISIKDRYRVCDSIGPNILGDFNIETGFYDFDMTVEGQDLTRLEDFRRHLPFWSRIESHGVVQNFSPYLFFLRSMEDLISYTTTPCR
jgi:hypothetical protein